MRTDEQPIQNYRLQIISEVKREDRFHSRYFDQQIAYRTLFRLSDGYKIESGAYQHFLKYTPTALAIDISMMVGCPMSCKFCESASFSYIRPLTVGEVVSQVTQLVEAHDTPPFPKIMCSFQGIGEPSLIPNEILRACNYLIKFDPRTSISIATTGTRLTAFKLWRESGVPIENLQISYSGTTIDQVDWLTPCLPPIDQLLNEAILCASSPNIQKVKFNYILIENFNDSDLDLQRLVLLFERTPVIVKISSLNPTNASNRYDLKPGSLTRAQEMCSELRKSGINSYVYGSFNTTNVSCGQLALIDEMGIDLTARCL